MTENVINSLVDEIERCGRVLDVYKSIGKPGAIGAALIQLDIDKAKKALSEMDTVKIISSLSSLRGVQL